MTSYELWLLHLGNEAGEGDLADKCVADVEEGAHSGDEGGPGHRANRHDRVAEFSSVAGRVVLDTSENSSKKDGDEGEDGGDQSQLGEAVESPGQGAEPANHKHDDGESDGPAADVVRSRHGVEVLGANKNVQTLDELGDGRSVWDTPDAANDGRTHSIVQEEHDCSEPPGPPLVPEDHLANIAYVANLGVTHAKLPSDQ